jgi:hypothetical protein
LSPNPTAGCFAVQRICPNPIPWHELFQQLSRYADSHPCTPARPPTPLILAGWAFTNDIEKRQRWRETVDWATANGCAALTEAIAERDFYETDNPTSYVIGPMGGPCYRPWDYERKERPPAEELAKHFEILSSRWADIAGPNLAIVTRPIAFTGKKARRLLVHADKSARPPWGGWSYLSTDGAQRRTFTRLRSTINKAVAPHEIDHVDFCH